MPFTIQANKQGLLLKLSGAVTVRHAQELGQGLAAALGSGMEISVQARDVEDIDTSILQMLVSLRRTAAAFALLELSQAFLSAVDRCALRRELLAGSKEML
jgi:anti-anti-sigma regulatory factor